MLLLFFLFLLSEPLLPLLLPLGLLLLAPGLDLLDGGVDAADAGEGHEGELRVDVHELLLARVLGALGDGGVAVHGAVVLEEEGDEEVEDVVREHLCDEARVEGKAADALEGALHEAREPREGDAVADVGCDGGEREDARAALVKGGDGGEGEDEVVEGLGDDAPGLGVGHHEAAKVLEHVADDVDALLPADLLGVEAGRHQRPVHELRGLHQQLSVVRGERCADVCEQQRVPCVLEGPELLPEACVKDALRLDDEERAALGIVCG